MLKCFVQWSVWMLAGLLAMASLDADTTNAAPGFRQVYDLLRSNLGMSDQELNSAAVEGLLNEMHGRASIVGGPGETPASQGKPALIESKILDNKVAYWLVGEVNQDLPDQLSAAYKRFSSTNDIAGVALDLRFAGGNDYAAAVATADLFTTKKMPLLKWDHETAGSHPAKTSISGPLMILINGRTSGAAEALAAALHEAGAGLIIGNPTAGLAMTTRDFPLKNGEWLRIASDPVKLGDGTEISRVPPDISVPVSVRDERAYLENPYATLMQNAPPALGTNSLLTFVDHTSEADLVREKLNDDQDVGATAPPAGKKPQKPVIQDPVLERAVDLIKGLAIVHEDRL
jgi:hypothetical protein